MTYQGNKTLIDLLIQCIVMIYLCNIGRKPKQECRLIVSVQDRVYLVPMHPVQSTRQSTSAL